MTKVKGEGLLVLPSGVRTHGHNEDSPFYN